MRTRALVAVGSSVGSFVVALVACGSSGGGAPSSPFVGTWSCTANETLEYTTPPGSQPFTATTSSTMIASAGANGTLSTASTTDAGVTCPLNYTTSGSTANLDPNQICHAGTLTLTYTQGTATVDAARKSLSATINYAFSGTTSAGDGGAPITVAGTGTSVYACTK